MSLSDDRAAAIAMLLRLGEKPTWFVHKGKGPVDKAAAANTYLQTIENAWYAYIASRKGGSNGLA